MATYFARATGNINATNLWSTTPTGATSNLFPSFTSSDILVSNSFTVTINVNATVLELRTDATGGATLGGGFNLSNGVTLTANIIGGNNNICLTYSGNTPNSATIVGNVTGGSTAGASGAARVSGTGTLNIVGNVTGGSGSSGMGIEFLTNAGTCTITGNVTGGSGTSTFGVGLSLANATCNITGTVSGGSNATAYGVSVSAISTLNVTGTVVGSALAIGVNITTSATVTATRAKGNGFGNGSVGVSSIVGIANGSQAATVRVYEIEYGDLGQTPTSGPIQLVDASSNVCLVYRTGGLGKKTLIDSASSSGAFPSASNVRSGVSYNNGNTVGTMAVPSAGSVAFGVSVDNTTGTAVLTPSGVWNHPISSITTVGSIGERAKNCSTIASVGQQLANALSPK